MSGTKGQGHSGGHNRLSAATHVLRNTWRPDRHPLPTGAPPARHTPMTPPRALLAKLGPAGRWFVRSAYEESEISGLAVPLLKLAAELYDDAATARSASDRKETRAAIRHLLAVLQRCGLPLPPER